MRVRLTKLWFGPDATRYRPGEHDMPDSWKDKLPKGTEIVGEEPAKKPAAKSAE